MLKKLFLVGITVALIVIAPNFETNTNDATTELDRTATKVETVAKAPKPTQEPLQQPEPQKSEPVPSVPEKAPEPAQIAATQANTAAAIGCGPHDPKVVYDILIEIGVPRLAAIQQVGSWTTESHLDQCQKIGDSGVAWGLNSWHPGRRHDMPEGLREQITWAIHTEMKRDCLSCYQQFMAAESVWSVREAIQRSTRWGVQGGRWMYADNYESQL